MYVTILFSRRDTVVPDVKVSSVLREDVKMEKAISSPKKAQHGDSDV